MTGPQRTCDAIRAALDDVLAAYPEVAARYYGGDRRRVQHDAALTFLKRGATIVDVGSGHSPLAATLSVLGMKAIMLDRFDYPVESQHGVDVAGISRALDKFGVDRITVDFAETDLPLAGDSADVVTCLAVIEHLHKSPRQLLHEIQRVLKPGGRIILSAPNAVNIRKRLSVLFGRTNLPSIQSFYRDGDPAWHGHVREPVASDLRWLLGQLEFSRIRLFGRNFVGSQNYGIPARLLSPLLQVRPGLCSDIYAVGVKRSH